MRLDIVESNNNYFQDFDPFDILKFETFAFKTFAFDSNIHKNYIRDFMVELKVQFMRRHLIRVLIHCGPFSGKLPVKILEPVRLCIQCYIFYSVDFTLLMMQDNFETS